MKSILCCGSESVLGSRVGSSHVTWMVPSGLCGFSSFGLTLDWLCIIVNWDIWNQNTPFLFHRKAQWGKFLHLTNGEGSPTRSPKARLQTTALPDLDWYLNPQETLSFWSTPNFPLQHLKGYNVSFMTELLTSRLERKSLLTRDRSQIPIKISRIWASSTGQSICALN